MNRDVRRCSHLALVLVLLAGVQTAESLAAEAPSRSTNFDAAWASYFASDAAAYVAVRTPSVEGPLIHSDIDSTTLNNLDNKNAPPSVNEMSKLFRDYVEEAKKQKLIQKNLSELVSEGFAMAISSGPTADQPSVLMVIPQTANLVKFQEWSIARYRKDHGADALKDVTVEGCKGVEFQKLEKAKPVLVKDAKVFVFANSADVAAKAIQRAKAGKDNISTNKAYQRCRNRVLPDAFAFAIVAPIPTLELVQKSAPPGPQNDPAKFEDARKQLAPLDGLLFQAVTGNKRTLMSMTAVLNNQDPLYSKFAKLLPTRTLKSASVVDVDAPAYFGLIRPTDWVASLQDSAKENFQNQMNSIKGTIQTQTGLDFDKDIAPWWGQELALVLIAPKDAPPQGALLVESTDAKATQAAIEKLVSHIKYNQNRNFEDKKVGSTNVKAIEKVSNPQMQQSPVNPAICTYENFLVIGSGMEIVENILRPDAKRLATAPGYIQLANNTGADRTPLLVYLKTELLVKATASNPQTANSPQLKQLVDEVDSLGISVGFPDSESVQMNLLFTGK